MATLTSTRSIKKPIYKLSRQTLHYRTLRHTTTLITEHYATQHTPQHTPQQRHNTTHATTYATTTPQQRHNSTKQILQNKTYKTFQKQKLLPHFATKCHRNGKKPP